MIISKKHCRVVLLSLLVSACSSSEDSTQVKKEKRQRQVEVFSTSIQPVSQQQTVSGTLEATTSVRLYNEENARITELPFHEGDWVNKGDTVIKLDSAMIQAELDKAIAEHRQAQVDLKRIKKLVRKKLASDDALAQAQTILDVALAEEKLQRTRFLRTTIKAPFNGVVTERNNEVGDAVASHTHIMSMIDPKRLHIEIQLSENWISIIDINSEVEISIDALDDTFYKGKISRIYPTINPDTRKGIAEIVFQQLPDGAQAGQLARVKIKSRSVERLLVPSHAIRHDSDGAYLFTVSENKQAKKIYVKKGLQLGNSIEITEGLQPGQQVIIRGFTYLRDGTDIKILSREDAA